MAKAAVAATVAISVSFADPMPAMAKFNNGVFNREKPAVEQKGPQKYTSEYVNSLTYSEIKGTGNANRCYDVEGEGALKIKSGMRITGMCIQPQVIKVADEKLTKDGV